MTRRHIHYEAAFEDYLRARRIPYVPVDESRRAIFSGVRVKSFDFLVYPDGGRKWIVDVKGRRFPYISEKGTTRYWENWVVRDDLQGLAEWQAVFGAEFEAYFVFAYLLEGPVDRWPAVRPHAFRGQEYVFLAVRLEDYRQHIRQRSPKWETVTIRGSTFRQLARPIESFAAAEPGRGPAPLATGVDAELEAEEAAVEERIAEG